MELEQAIKERRTIRNFLDREIPLQFINECIDSARYAPIAGNIQNSRFIVIRKKQTKEEISKACENQKWIAKSPAIIVVCSELPHMRRMFSVRGEALYSVQNTAAAIQNILLKAYELKIGTAWIGAFNEEKIREIAGIPGDARPQAIIAMGYYKETEQEIKREPLNNIEYFEQYGKRADKTQELFPIGNKITKVLGKIGDKYNSKVGKK